jgi:hypothetical protein
MSAMSIQLPRVALIVIACVVGTMFVAVPSARGEKVIREACIVAKDNQSTRRIMRRATTLTGQTGSNNTSFDPAISSNGNVVAFASFATNLEAGTIWPSDQTPNSHVFAVDRESDEMELIDRDLHGDIPQADAEQPSVSTDGRYVAFASWAPDLVQGDNNGWEDVFVLDRLDGRMRLVSTGSGGAQGNNSSWNPSISGDGRYVAFVSWATNFKGEDAVRDIYVKDLQTGSLTLASKRSNGTFAQLNSDDPALSRDASDVAFMTHASLVNADTNGAQDIYVHTLSSATSTRVSLRNDGNEGNNSSIEPDISNTGRYVAFSSFASNLIGSNDTNNVADVFKYDRQSSSIVRVSKGATQFLGGDSHHPSISGTGHLSAFDTDATNVPGDANGQTDVYEYDTDDNSLGRLSSTSDDTIATGGPSLNPDISNLGDVGIFESRATNLDPDDQNGTIADIYSHIWVDFSTSGRGDCATKEETKPLPFPIPILGGGGGGGPGQDWDERCQPFGERPASEGGPIDPLPIPTDPYAVHATSGSPDQWNTVSKPFPLQPPTDNVYLRWGQDNTAGYLKVAWRHGWGPIVKSQVTQALTNFTRSFVAYSKHQGVRYEWDYPGENGITCTRVVLVQFLPVQYQIDASKPSWSIITTWSAAA